ncbi:MAG: hypothetical protein ABIJ39_13875 [Chloroflexota bacterium]
MKARTVPQRGFNLDYLMWLFTRLSALTMYLFAIIGISAALLMGAREQMNLEALLRWTFMPNPSHVATTDVVDLDAWGGAFWQIIAILFVFFAGTHGLNGLRVVIEDFLNPTWLRVMLRGLIFLVWLFMIIVGIYVIVTS